MKQKRFNVEQIVAVLKQAEAGVPHGELIRRVGINLVIIAAGEADWATWKYKGRELPAEIPAYPPRPAI